MAPGATKGRSRIGVGNPAPGGRKAFHLYKNLLRDVSLASASHKEASPRAERHWREATRMYNIKPD
jgi:hypothetical protein